jgi:hypothetical protein
VHGATSENICPQCDGWNGPTQEICIKNNNEEKTYANYCEAFQELCEKEIVTYGEQEIE